MYLQPGGFILVFVTGVAFFTTAFFGGFLFTAAIVSKGRSGKKESSYCEHPYFFHNEVLFK